jgi:hypothetical protein
LESQPDNGRFKASYFNLNYPEKKLLVPSRCRLWRYMDLAGFVSMLEYQALHFSHPSRFEDPYEGTLTSSSLKKFSKELRERHISHLDPQKIKLSKELGLRKPNPLEESWYATAYRAVYKATYVNWALPLG